VPAIAEAGMPGFLALTWAGLVGPARLPPAIVARLNTAMNRTLQAPEVVAHMVATGSTIRGGTPEEFREFMAAEIARWGDYDYVIVNEDFDLAYAELAHIYHAERLKGARNPWLKPFVDRLMDEPI
jgi:hypothetical protein